MGVTTTPATGSRGTIHIAQEASFGVLVAPTHLIEFTSESLSAQESELMSEAIRDHRGMSQLVRGNLDIQGDINFEQNASGLGMILRHALGDYIKVPSADGGHHGRVMQSEQALIHNATVATATDEPLTLSADRLSAQVDDVLLRNIDSLTSVQYSIDGGVNYLALPAGTVATVTDSLLGIIGFSVALPSGTTNVRATFDHFTVDRYAIPFTLDHSSPFLDGGKFVRVFRNANRKLELDSASGAGYEFADFVKPAVTYAVDVTAGVVQLANVLGPDGILESPAVAPAGLIVSGSGRVMGSYYASGTVVVAGEEFSTITLSPGATVADNDYVMIVPALLKATAFGVTPGKGDWLYAYDPVEYAGVFTHHMERGRYLPTGLTVEVHRDAAVFLYTGCKVNSLALTFDANSIVTGTASLIGKVEYSIATLVADVVPGAATIDIDKRDAFPDAGYLTIGEETNIAYSGIIKVTLPGNREIYRITITSTNVEDIEAIQRFHPKGQNVDSRSSRKAGTIYSGNTSPLTSFETLVYIDGYWEEVLSANFTLNNNLTTDKFGLGSRFRLATVEGRAEIDGTLSMEFDDGKHYNKFLRGEKFSIEFKCVAESDDSLIGTTGVPSQAYYFLPKCKYNGTTPQIGGPDIINHDMPFRAIVDNEFGETDLVIILVNGLEQDVEI
jgi:hypothetical protein